MLRGFNKTKANNAYPLFQSLAVAIRPLRIVELAELLAFDLLSSGEIEEEMSVGRRRGIRTLNLFQV